MNELYVTDQLTAGLAYARDALARLATGLLPPMQPHD